MGILSYGYKASKTPVGKKVVETVKNIFKGGKQKTTGTEVVQPFKYQKGRSDTELKVNKLITENKKQNKRFLSDVQKSFSGLDEARTKLKQTTQKLAGEPITKSGVSKGKNIKNPKPINRAKGGRVGLKAGTNPFARKSNIKKIQETFGPKKPKKRMQARKGSPDPKKKKKFPDLTGDGKVTFADVLKGRGVINGKKNKTKKKFI